MAGEEGPVLNQNQAPNQNPHPNKNPQKFSPPLYSFMPNTPVVLVVPQRPQLNRSHFKPKYAGKPDEDVEVHLLRVNDWMDTHELPDQV